MESQDACYLFPVFRLAFETQGSHFRACQALGNLVPQRPLPGNGFLGLSLLAA